MLVLSRQIGQSIQIGKDVKIVVLEIVGDKVKIGIDAPKAIPVHRQEVAELIAKRDITEPNPAKSKTLVG